MADNLQTFAAICAGGLVTNVDPITQSSKMPGSAISLINMEPSLEGGYRRISGFSNSYGTMPGEGKVLGLTVNGEINQGIFAARKPETGSNYFHFYNNHYTCIDKALDPSIIKNTTIFEKSQIKWVSIDELKNLELRKFYQPIVRNIINERVNIEQFIKRVKVL